MLDAHCSKNAGSSREVSVIIPCYNASKWLEECLRSVLEQDCCCSMLEVSIYNDASTDDTDEVIGSFRNRFNDAGIQFIYSTGTATKGVGFAKNSAVKQSCGRFLCFLDADDFISPDRIRQQLTAANSCRDPEICLIGSRFRREPPDSTERFTRWANGLSQQQLYTQIYTSHGPTVVAPTWFTSRKLFDLLNGFNDSQATGYPEDLDFFYRAIRFDIVLRKVDKELVTYRYHNACATFGVSDKTIFEMRVRQFQEQVLSKWDCFTIWNAGKQGKQFYKSLAAHHQRKVVAFCDVDAHKISRNYCELFDQISRRVITKIPIISYIDATPPVVLCVKLDLTGGAFEKLLSEKNWIDGVDYFHF